MLLFLWALLTNPVDRMVCSMWVSQPPTVADMRAAGCVWADIETPDLIMRAVDIVTGAVACEQPASHLPALDCDLWPLHNYQLMVIRPKAQYLVCTIKVRHEGQPTAAEIAAQCPQAPPAYELRYSGTLPTDPAPTPLCVMPALLPGPGPLDLPASPIELATNEPYALLAGELIWHGFATPDCDGWSGLIPETRNANECGIRSAMPALLEWQNRFDRAIYQESVSAGVPPRLLKQVIAQESQFWPWAEGTVGEAGMTQVTDGALDLSLRYSPRLFERTCPLAVNPSRCAIGYANLTIRERNTILVVLRNSIAPAGGPHATGWTADMEAYALILAAHYCAAGEIVNPSWQNALILYHAGFACLSNGCSAGREYVEKVMR